MKTSCFTLVILVLAIRSCFAVKGTTDAKNIFVLAGQSNMAGRGSIYESIPERKPDQLILRFTANRKWEVASDPLHQDIDTAKAQSNGVGPGLPFAKRLLKRVPDFGVIGLVPCAIGDTSISDWSKGSPLPYYNNTVARAQAAVGEGGGTIRAILWYQGEKDTGTRGAPPVYKIKFQNFIKDLRTDLQLPLLPVIEVALAYENMSNADTALVRKAQLETAVEVEKVGCVDAKGLEINSVDHVHLTTAAQIKLGAIMADAYLGPDPKPQSSLCCC